MDILTHPLVLALLALLGIPAVTSAVAGVLKWITDYAGIPAPVVVYIASALLTGVMIWGADVPVWAGDPASYVALWTGWLVANAALARRLYEVIWERVTPPAEPIE